MALPKQFRLKRKDVRNIFAGSRRFSSVVGTFFLKKNGLGVSRFGFAVPVSVSKKSNTRNKLKRMVAERVRIGLQDIVTGFDVMIIFKKGAGSIIKKEFYKQLKDSFIKAGLFRGNPNDSNRHSNDPNTY